MEEEIKERIAIGNKVYFANKKMFQSRLISKRAKLKLEYSVIRPVVTYSCETWTLTLRVLMSYTYGAPILDVSRSHTTTQHSR